MTAALGAGALLGPVSGAAALTGAPVTAGTPNQDDSASVAVDAAGTAYIAWRQQQQGSGDILQYCVIPLGGTACAHQGNLQPADSALAIDGVNVVVDGSVVVLLADVYGTAGAQAADYQPEQEWQSTDGGATFNLVLGGLSVANANLSADTGPNNAIIVPGTNVLGMGWTTAAGPPTFNAFPLNPTSECSKAMCATGFAQLEASTQPAIGNVAGHFASQAGSSPGILAVFDGGGNPPLACTNQDTITYAYGAGNQSASNDYNLDPGKPGSAWQVPVSQGVCNAKYPAAAGGPSGFGMVADNNADGTTSYWRFDQAHTDFDIAPVVISKQGQLSASVGQDASGGIYATFMNNGSGGPLALAYSSDGGATWLGPETLEPDATGRDHNLSSAVSQSGHGWIVWTKDGTIYAQQFDKTDANPLPTAISTAQTAGTVSGPSLTIAAGTTGESDQATLLGTNAKQAGGALAYALYSDPACKTKVFDGGAVTVLNGAVGASKPVTVALPAGTYYWQAVYSGDNKLNAASASTCGGEVLTVTAPQAPQVKLGGSASSTTTTITVTVTCSSTPCTVTLTITVTVTSKAADIAAKSKPRTTKVTLGRGTFTIRKKGPQHLVIHLSKAGRRYLASHRGRTRALLTASEKTTGRPLTSSRKISITHAKKSKKH